MNWIIHYNDLDGCGAAACVLLSPRCPAPVKLVEGNYSDPLDLTGLVKGDSVFIVDYTPGKEDFQRILDVVGTDNLLWFDHHRTNYERIPNHEDIPGVRSDTLPSATKLVYEYLLQPVRLAVGLPACIDAVDRWDTWTHADDPTVLHFKWGATANGLENNPKARAWKQLLGPYVQATEMFNEICRDGSAAYRFEQNKMAERIKSYSFEVELPRLSLGAPPLKGLALNAGFANSKAFDSVASGEYDVFVTFYTDGLQWRVSLYKARPALDTHIGEYCKQLAGGGGHAGCGGMVLPSYPNWLKPA